MQNTAKPPMQTSQQQSQTPKKQESVLSFKYQPQGETIGQCPNCSAELPEDAIFCPECGFSKGLVCPKCGKINAPSSDICQYCKTWLLKGKCKFCYSDVDEGDAYCAECAKPKNGIPCPKCGQLSIFDFCKNCGTAVTKEAIEEIQTAQGELIAAQKEMKIPAASIQPLASGRTVSAPASAAPQSVADSEEDSSSRRIVLKPKPEVQPETISEVKQEAQTVITIEEAKKQAKENAQKKFSTPQAARRWHMARRHPDALGWLCNYAGCVHLYAEGGGPDDCNDPSKGGADFFGTMDDIFMNEYGFYQPKK